MKCLPTPYARRAAGRLLRAHRAKRVDIGSDGEFNCAQCLTQQMDLGMRNAVTALWVRHGLAVAKTEPDDTPRRSQDGGLDRMVGYERDGREDHDPADGGVWPPRRKPR